MGATNKQGHVTGLDRTEFEEEIERKISEGKIYRKDSDRKISEGKICRKDSDRKISEKGLGERKGSENEMSRSYVPGSGTDTSLTTVVIGGSTVVKWKCGGSSIKRKGSLVDSLKCVSPVIIPKNQVFRERINV